MLRVVTDDDARAEMVAALDEIVLDGARRMLAAALEAEVDAYIAGLAGERVRRRGWTSLGGVSSRPCEGPRSLGGGRARRAARRRRGW